MPRVAINETTRDIGLPSDSRLVTANMPRSSWCQSTRERERAPFIRTLPALTLDLIPEFFGDAMLTTKID